MEYLRSPWEGLIYQVLVVWKFKKPLLRGWCLLYCQNKAPKLCHKPNSSFDVLTMKAYGQVNIMSNTHLTILKILLNSFNSKGSKVEQTLPTQSWAKGKSQTVKFRTLTNFTRAWHRGQNAHSRKHFDLRFVKTLHCFTWMCQGWWSRSKHSRECIH